MNDKNGIIEDVLALYSSVQSAEKILEEVKLTLTADGFRELALAMAELKAYRSVRYVLEQGQELHDKHWSECRQIALYDDQIKQMQEHIDRLKGIIDGLYGYVGGDPS